MRGLIDRFKSLPLIASVRARLEKSNVLRRFLSGSFWLFIGNLTWKLPSALTTIIVGRLLGPVGFGEFGIITSTVNMFAVYGGLRLGATSAKYVAEHRVERPQKAARILKLTLAISLVSCLAVSAALFVFAPKLAASSLKRPELAGGLTIASALLFFRVYGGVQETVLSGFENFRALARVSMLRGVITPLLCIPFAWLWGVEGAIAGLSLVAAIAFVWLFLLIRQERTRAGFGERISFRTLRDEVPILWTFALPGLLTGIVMTLSLWLSRIMLARQGDGYADLGLFEAAYQWRSAILFLPAIMARTMLPILSESYGRDSTGDFVSAVSLQIRSVCITSVPLVILTIGFADILAAVYGEGFAAAAVVIPVMMSSIFFYAHNRGLRQVYDGAGRRWISFGMYILWSAVLLVSCFALLPRSGPAGLAWANLLAEATLFIVQALYIDIVLAPGIIRRRIGLLSMSLALIGLQYFAWGVLPGFWSAVSGGGLAAASFFIMVRTLAPRKS